MGDTTATALFYPDRLSVDLSGNVWVSEYSNNRVLEYTAATIAAWTSGVASSADLVLGQPDFTTNTSGTTATTLKQPKGLAVDSSGNVWVGDTSNNRVLRYDGFGGTGYTVSGNITVSGVALFGVTVTVSGSSSTFTTTDALGNYSFTLPGGGNYTLTPTKANYSFAPVSVSTAGLVANWTGKNFAATLNSYTVSGTVTDGSTAVAGVTVTVSGSSSTFTTTDASGNYSFTLPGEGNYTLTPSKANYSFAPVSVSSTNLSGNWTGNNFTATLNSHTVSGTVTVGGSALQGVTVTVSGGASATATTDSSGNYSFTLPGGVNYTLTPIKTNYTFTPATLSTTTLSGNWTGNNFAATLGQYTVSGTVTSGASALQGVTVTVSGGVSTSANTDASGNYSFTLPGNANYTLTPSKANYSFAPVNVSSTNLSGNWTGNNFAATPNTYTVSGIITSGGSRFQGVTVTVSGGASASDVTDSLGNYSFTLTAGLAYTLTPSKSGYTFTPVSYSTPSLGGNWSGSNFVGAVSSYLISGTIKSGGVAMAGVTVTLDGQSHASTNTDASGYYSFLLQPGSYGIIPSSSYTMSPLRRSITVVSSNIAGNDFAGTDFGGRSLAVTGGPDGYAQPTRGYYATIKFISPGQSGNVDVMIYTLRSGRLVRTLRKYVSALGTTELVWDCRNSSGELVGSGIYVAVVNDSGYHYEKLKIGVLK